MRDVNRIKPFCDEFAELWEKYPDLRFGQLIVNAVKYTQFAHGKDAFYMEDDEFMEVLKEQMR